MKSALFVDFDNVFSQLRHLQPEAAERFARHPAEWIGWLTESLPLPEPHGESQRRRLLVRRCYLNPNWYQTYRHAFLRAGFEIVDCPPVTSQGKTSTDIHMVLDVIDLLQHETRYDEFIVFSADADFTPVLRKLRRYDRRTTVLAIGFPSAAYQASADLLIDERLFLQEALGFGRNPAESASAANVPAGPAASTPAATEPAEPRPPATEPHHSGAASTGPAKTAPSTERPARPASAAELTTVANRLWTIVEESAEPVDAELLASRLRQDFPELGDHWNGHGTFKSFFRSLGLSRLLWLNGPVGRVYDPARHDAGDDAPVLDADSPWAGFEDMFDVARQVCSLTGAPMLAPKELQTVLGLVAEDSMRHPFELNATVRRVCAKCLDTRNLRIRLRDASFILRGMQLNGHVFGQGHDDAATLAARFVDQVLFLCQREQMLLDEGTVDRIRRWIGGGEMPPVELRGDSTDPRPAQGT